MTPEEFERRMFAICGGDDFYDYEPESSHIEADELLCEVLTQLGYEKGVTIFKNATRWYA